MLIVIVSAAVLWLPGAVLARACRLAPGYEFALGLAFWPLLFLFTSLVGWTWTPLGARFVLGLLLVAPAAGRLRCGPAARGPPAGRRRYQNRS